MHRFYILKKISLGLLQRFQFLFQPTLLLLWPPSFLPYFLRPCILPSCFGAVLIKKSIKSKERSTQDTVCMLLSFLLMVLPTFTSHHHVFPPFLLNILFSHNLSQAFKSSSLKDFHLGQSFHIHQILYSMFENVFYFIILQLPQPSCKSSILVTSHFFIKKLNCSCKLQPLTKKKLFFLNFFIADNYLF